MKHLHISLLYFLSALIASSCAEDTLFDNNYDSFTGEIDFSVNSDWNETETSRSISENDSITPSERILKEIIPLAVGNSTDSLYLYVFEETLPNPTATDTRGTMIENPYSDMSVTGIKFDHSAGWQDYKYTPEFMYNVKYEESNGCYSVPKGDKKYLWPGEEYDVRFYAVMPYGSGTLSSATTKGAPTFTYTIPSDVAQQKELFFGQTEDLRGDGKRRTPINMERALASIRFEESDDLLDGSISYIKISGIYGTGTYRFSSKRWSTGSYTTSYRVDVGKIVPEGEGSPITGSNQNFFLIPQSFGSSATIEIGYYADKMFSEVNLTTQLKGSLSAGKSYVFRLATSNLKYVEDFSVSVPETLRLDGPSADVLGELQITSGRTLMQGERQIGYWPLGWETKLYEYNPATGKYDKPMKEDNGLIEGIPASSFGNNTCQLKISSDYGESTAVANNNILKSAAQKGTTTKPWNLANSTGAEKDENTANCYIVNAPGTYSIPLVYGNAIKNGSFNPALGINSSLCGERDHSVCPDAKILHPYPIAPYIYNDTLYTKSIRTPYIYDNAPLSPVEFISGADLNWTDKASLITNVKLSDDHKRIIFTINKNHIEQGNAFIVVKGLYNQALWGWHIWITPYQSGVGDKTVTDKNGNETIFMPYNLGWIDQTKHYAEKTIRLEVTQNETGKKFECMLRVPEQTRIDGHSALWLEGYPFPVFSSKSYLPHENRKWDSYYPSSDRAFLTSRIRYLEKINNQNYKPSFYNLWDLGKTSSRFSDWIKYEYVKNIYDPCPVGYTVAGIFAYTNFTNSELNGNTYEYYNVNEKKDSNGTGAVFYYCNPDFKGDVITFPYTTYIRDKDMYKTTDAILLTPYTDGQRYRSFTPNVTFTNDSRIQFNSTDNFGSGYPAFLPIRAIKELQ
ncbi:MAG: fimbrillin family protein [Muribaculaceae bacterium]|nr:fimbrillin family protein [Muribaculaceae bacterium]